jgi:hypothetical protein
LKSLAFLPLIACFAVPHTVRAADPCSAAYEHAQERRIDGDLVHAREQLLLCNKPECADFIRQDCGQWLGEVETALPSVTIEATGAGGAALTQVSVSVDGVLVASALSGLSLPMNPGTRHFKLESAGYPAIERDLFLAEGQKSQLLQVAFAPTVATPTPDTAAATAGQRPRVSPAVYAFGTLGVVGLAGFAAFGLSGTSAERSLRASPCASTHTCADSQTSPIERKYLIADVSLGVGVLSLGAAAYFLFASREPSKAASELRSLPRVAVSAGQSSLFATWSASY